MTMFDELLALCRGLSPMQVVGVILILFWCYTLHRWSRDPAYDNFKLIYCVSNRQGYPDNAKIREWGAYFVSTYGFLWLLWGRGMTEWYFVGYMAAWVAAAAYALKKRLEQGTTPPHVQTQTTVTSSTETGKPQEGT